MKISLPLQRDSDNSYAAADLEVMATDDAGVLSLSDDSRRPTPQ